MSSNLPDTNEPHNPADLAAGRHPLVVFLSVLLFLEALAIAGASIYLVIEILVTPANSIGSAIALAAVAIVAAIWVFVIAINVLRGNAWVRGASIVVQILLAALAIGSFQGQDARPALGVAILVPVILVLLLLFARPVVLATSRRS